MRLLRTNFIISVLLLFSLSALGQTRAPSDYLVSFVDTTKDEYGYKNQNGDIVIELGKYSICFTDTFKTYAIVLKPHAGFVAINRQQKVLYEIFPFDNGPDYPSEGLFRILKNNKIGYADSTTGKIIIKPQFDCAFPFANGIAKVSTNCKEKSDGEHAIWISNSWFYIDKKGRKVDSKGRTK